MIKGVIFSSAPDAMWEPPLSPAAPLSDYPFPFFLKHSDPSNTYSSFEPSLSYLQIIQSRYFFFCSWQQLISLLLFCQVTLGQWYSSQNGNNVKSPSNSLWCWFGIRTFCPKHPFIPTRSLSLSFLATPHPLSLSLSLLFLAVSTSVWVFVISLALSLRKPWLKWSLFLFGMTEMHIQGKHTQRGSLLWISVPIPTDLSWTIYSKMNIGGTMFGHNVTSHVSSALFRTWIEATCGVTSHQRDAASA